MRSLSVGRGWQSCFAVACLVALWSANAFAQERFRLVVEGDASLTSAASLTRTELSITDRQGITHRYAREPRFDTPDGAYQGYLSRAAQQAIRWPTAGAGTMLIGDPQGVAWRASAQQVTRVPVAGQPVIRPNPPRPGNLPDVGILPVAPNPQFDGTYGFDARGQFGAVHLGIGHDRQGESVLVMIDDPERVRVYKRDRENWQHTLDIRGYQLVPGAPSIISADITPGLPRVYTVNSQGQLILLTHERGAIPVAQQIPFPPGAALGTDNPAQGFAAAVDMRGQLWELDLKQQRHRVIDGTAGRFLPGSQTAVTQSSDGLRTLRQVYAIDARGGLTRYTQLGVEWAPAENLAEGFVPGSPIAAAELVVPGRGSQRFLAAVDWRGRLQLMTETTLGVQMQVVDTGALPPGADLRVDPAIDGLRIAGIGNDGGLRVWGLGMGGTWSPQVVSIGFPAGAPVFADPADGGLLAVDVRGRIVPAHFHEGEWHCHLCQIGVPQAPRLVSRRIVPGTALPPARVTLANSGQSNVIVQVADALNPLNSRDVPIPPGQAVEEIFDRDAGGMIEEVYMVPGPAGDWYEQVEQYPLPPQPRYSLAVWEGRVTYSYVDNRKNKPAGAVPSFDVKNNVSIGVFDLPPGELLRDGQSIDVFRAAASNRNPGAAGYFGPPQVAPEVIPRE
jgi:hypothetical protein